MAFTCGINNPDGSQCLHNSRREALGCITRGKVIDSLNRATKERDVALEMVEKANKIASEQVDKITKLETQAVEATAALKAQNDMVARLEASLKIVTTERDALAQAAIHEAQKNLTKVSA